MRFPAPYRPSSTAGTGTTGARAVDDADLTRPSDRLRPSSRVDVDRLGLRPSDPSTGGTPASDGPARPDWSSGGRRDVRSVGSGDDRRGRPNPLDLPADDRRTGGRVDYGRGPVQRLAAPREATPAPRPTADRPGLGAPDRGRPDGPAITPSGRRDVRSVGGGSRDGDVVGGGLRAAPRGTGVGAVQRADPRTTARVRTAALNLDRARRAALGSGLAALGGVRSGAYHGGYGGFDRYGYNNPWGFGYWNGHWSFYWGFDWYWGDCWWYWPSYVSCYYPWWYYRCRPYYYTSWYYPTVYSSVVYRTVYEDRVVYVDDSEGHGEAVAEVVPAQPVAPAIVPRAEETLSIAAERYLTLGDRAFREGRWSDAVQLYAKAVELAPDNAGLYLVLADALFSAGDYHYAAYAIRKAVELDPVLLSVPIDKHGFYPDPAEFDRQLARLETYVLEHPTDRDARLVLAVNFLFGGRPAAAVDLYAEGVAPAAALAQDDAVRLTLESARALQYGQPTGER